MPSLRATERASSMSRSEQQPFERSSRHSPEDQVWIVTPTGSYPCRFRSHAQTELSTPPDIATTTRLLVIGAFKRALKFLQTFAETLADLGQAVRPEQKKRREDNDQELGKSDAEHDPSATSRRSTA